MALAILLPGSSITTTAATAVTPRPTRSHLHGASVQWWGPLVADCQWQSLALHRDWQWQDPLALALRLPLPVATTSASGPLRVRHRVTGRAGAAGPGAAGGPGFTGSASGEGTNCRGSGSGLRVTGRAGTGCQWQPELPLAVTRSRSSGLQVQVAKLTFTNLTHVEP